MSNHEKRIIKEFELDKSKEALVHPFFKDKTQYGSSIDIYLITIGHLWIYQLIEEYGYCSYLNELIAYSIKTSNSLLEWDITNEMEKDIKSILTRHNVVFQKYVCKDLEIMKYKNELDKSKDKEHPYHQITRLLFLVKFKQMGLLIKQIDLNGDIEKVLKDKGTVINAAYLGLEYTIKEKGESIVQIPEILITIVQNNMSCHVERNELKYYPRMEVFVHKISNKEKELSANWYLLTETEQVIISKLLYSFRLIAELSYTLIGANGILSTFVTRTLFDNFWQTKFLITNNKIDEYRLFALDRMRLHILKRSDLTDVSSINDLLSEIEGGVLDPIPIHGDYFKKSAREYSIELDLKDEYDKYYEYNSEFIHASLTAVYSGIMKQCSNPEHNKHLTIHPSASYYINSMRHIFEILNMHINLVNNFFGEVLLETYDVNEFFFKDREEFNMAMSRLYK